VLLGARVAIKGVDKPNLMHKKEGPMELNEEH
jgi:hypothetical protein